MTRFHGLTRWRESRVGIGVLLLFGSPTVGRTGRRKGFPLADITLSHGSLRCKESRWQNCFGVPRPWGCHRGSPVDAMLCDEEASLQGDFPDPLNTCRVARLAGEGVTSHGQVKVFQDVVDCLVDLHVL